MITKTAFLAHPTRDLERARTFFGETLGLERAADYGDHWTEYRTPEGTTIALDTFSSQFDDKAPVYLALETDDIEAEVERLREAGVQVVKEPWTNEDQEGTEVCKMAIVLDPDGHSIMLHQIAAHRA